jgi:hypothetical protein
VYLGAPYAFNEIDLLLIKKVVPKTDVTKTFFDTKVQRLPMNALYFFILEALYEWMSSNYQLIAIYLLPNFHARGRA